MKTSPIKKALATFLLIIMTLSVSTFFMPMSADAFSLVYTCTDGPVLYAGSTEHECDFVDFLGQINQLITDAFILAIPIATIVLTWAGVLLMTSRGNVGQMERAKKMMWTTLVGFLFICAAWVLVYFIVTSLGCTTCSEFLGGGTSATVTTNP